MGRAGNWKYITAVSPVLLVVTLASSTTVCVEMTRDFGFPTALDDRRLTKKETHCHFDYLFTLLGGRNN